MRLLIFGTLLLGITGQTLADTSPHDWHQKLQTIADVVDAKRIQQDVVQLVNFGTRHTLSQANHPTRGIGAARRWLARQFQNIAAECGGCLKVETVSATVQGRRIPTPTEVVNVLAILPGTKDPKRVVMMTGDIDSRASDVMDAESDAPGANDNASGLAAVLEAARVLSKHRFGATIVFAGLSGEEQGLYGGKILAQAAKQRGWRIEAVINNDMIGNIEGIDGVIDNTVARIFSEGTRADETPEMARYRRFHGGEVDSPSRNLARYVDRLADQYLSNLDTWLIYRLDRFGRGGHHRPFNDAGFPAIRLMEAHEHYHRQHQNVRTENGVAYGDVVSGVNFDYAAKLTRLNTITLASLAWAPAPPINVTLVGAVTANTTLCWQPHADDKTKVAKYRIYWRRTDQPQWQYMREVGTRTQWTLNNIILDNYYFGVSAVSNNGFESPIVFPGPIGAFTPWSAIDCSPKN